METYLITGGAGFIGSNFIQHMIYKYSSREGMNDPIKIINLDALTYAGDMQNLNVVASHPAYHFIHGDICDEPLVRKIFENHDIKYVVNFAAESHVDRSIQNADVFLKTNIMGTFNLLKTAQVFWATNKQLDEYQEGCRFLQVSTDEVYGSLGDSGYFTEETNLDPHSPYAASKACADHLVKSYYDTHKMPVLITRCSNNYGPYQHVEKLIPKVISYCLECKKIPVYGDGQNVRDWLFVEDHCKAIDDVIHRGQLGHVYNIGGHNEMKNLEIIRLIMDTLKEKLSVDDPRRKMISEELIQYVPDRKGHDWRYAINAKKIKNSLGWTPETIFKKGIDMTISWYLEEFDKKNRGENVG